jgi:hypothetical protein
VLLERARDIEPDGDAEQTPACDTQPDDLKCGGVCEGVAEGLRKPQQPWAPHNGRAGV